MPTEERQNDTPIFNELIAQRVPKAAERIVDMPPPASALGSQALQETRAVPTSQHTETKPEREKRLLSTTGYSSGAKAVVDAINNAILDGDRAIIGKPFSSYLKDHQPYITAHEFTKLQEEVRAL